MTRDREGETINQGGASEPAREERDREFAGIAGNAAGKGEDPSPDDRERGESSSADDSGAIDLDAARERAS